MKLDHPEVGGYECKAGWSLLRGLRVAGWELRVRDFLWTLNPQLL